MVARPLDPAIKPWPAPTGGLDPPPAALELGRQQIEGDYEENPALQDRHQPTDHCHDQAGDDRDGLSGLRMGAGLSTLFASLAPSGALSCRDSGSPTTQMRSGLDKSCGGSRDGFVTPTKQRRQAQPTNFPTDLVGALRL
jgi:hypothetical protein